MTPKEKAEELVKKMYHLDNRAWYETCKQCALIAVDEMIKQQQIQFDEMVWSCVGYWNEVKHEIEKL
jgi:hypothetical protein